MLPSVAISKSNLDNTLLGGACREAGPANALPVRGSYMLPWHGHSPLFLPSWGQYFQRHQRCKHTWLYILNAETSFLVPPSSSGKRINCHTLNDSLFNTGSLVLGYITASE